MSWWSRLTGGKSGTPAKSQRMDYLSEALALERQGDFAAALTSYRLALRDKPDDHRVLQNMAIAYTRTGQVEEAVRCYRRALDLEPSLSGAHYGLAFLLLKRDDLDGAVAVITTSADRARDMKQKPVPVVAVAHGGSAIALVRADLTALPFADDSFDVVLAPAVLGLLDVRLRHRALAEVVRVARTELRLLEPLHRPGEPVHLRFRNARVFAEDYSI